MKEPTENALAIAKTLLSDDPLDILKDLDLSPEAYKILCERLTRSHWRSVVVVAIGLDNTRIQGLIKCQMTLAELQLSLTRIRQEIENEIPYSSHPETHLF